MSLDTTPPNPPIPPPPKPPPPQSAFNHILSDVSLVVYQFESLAGFSAVVDRLGEFSEVSDIKLRHVFTLEGEGAGGGGSSSGGAATTAAAAPAATSSQPAAASLPAAAAANGSKAQPSSSPALQRAARPTAASAADAAAAGPGGITIMHLGPAAAANGGPSPQSDELLLELRGLCISTPDGSAKLAQNLDLQVRAGEPLLIVGPSGAGKTSVLRALAGLWQAGSGSILSYGLPGLGDPGCQPGSVLFLPQKPYMVLGSLRDQLLYPTWSERGEGSGNGMSSSSSDSGSSTGSSGYNAPAGKAARKVPPPDDDALEAALRLVQLTQLLDRCRAAVVNGRAGRAAAAASGGAEGEAASAAHISSANGAGPVGGANGGSGIAGGAGSSSPLDCVADWAQLLSLGEQQRLAFARLLLTAPRLALVDEATSALDTTNEALLYQVREGGGGCWQRQGWSFIIQQPSQSRRPPPPSSSPRPRQSWTPA